MNSIKLIFFTFLAAGSVAQVSYAEEQKTKSPTEETKKLYKVVDQNGKVHYSDQPSTGAEEIKTDKVTTIKMTKTKVDFVATDDENQVTRDPNAEYYDFIGFQNLVNEGVIRNNGGSVTLSVKIEPNLSKSHFIKFFIDGELIKEQQKELTITAQGIEYGEHNAYFTVVSRTGALVQQSETVNFILLHTARKKVGSVNNLTSDYFKTKLPQHPTVPKYKPITGSDN